MIIGLLFQWRLKTGFILYPNPYYNEFVIKGLYSSVFLQEGLDLTAADKNGKTPLMLATGRKHLMVVDYIKTELKQRNSLLPKIDFW